MMRFFVILLWLLTDGTAPSYVLPYAKDSSHKILQAFNGPYGHEGHAAFAYDFQMPIGTPVHAARSGKVVHVESRHKDATRKAGEENVIVIRHDDGTFARYYHLTQNGVKVALGEEVTQIQMIGLSGDSGASAGPHLHFDVTKDCFEWGCQTVKFEFQNVKENPLQAGKSY
jgi:murein DD-endopeptidase MepM/ murein hydrolase activator NlpD